MKLIDFISMTNLNKCIESERAKLLCFYYYKETKKRTFTMSDISDMMCAAGLNAPNTSRLRNKLLQGKEKILMPQKGSKCDLEFIPAIFQGLEKEYGEYWNDTEIIESSSEIVDETKFCGERGYLDKLIFQINHSYAHNCYDACAVLMRRLFEVLLVLSYQESGIDDEIKDSTGSGYIMLDGIVKNAKNNTVLKLSRVKNEFDTFRSVGNFSAHSITYTAGKKDIDDIKLSFRVMLEELFCKAGLIK